MWFKATIVSLFSVFTINIAYAESISIAVASNFYPTLSKLSKQFEEEYSIDVKLSFASTGKLYIQIIHGAPFDIFFSADALKTKQLLQDDLAVPGTEKTYALGQIVFLSQPSQEKNKFIEHLLHAKQVVIANPKFAPYGKASQEIIKQLKLKQPLKLVMTDNIGHAFSLFYSGQVDAGFFALSQWLSWKEKERGKTQSIFVWHVPNHYYSPISQKVVLLKRAENNVPAKRFLKFLEHEQNQKLIDQAGYRVEANDSTDL